MNRILDPDDHGRFVAWTPQPEVYVDDIPQGPPVVCVYLDPERASSTPTASTDPSRAVANPFGDLLTAIDCANKLSESIARGK